MPTPGCMMANTGDSGVVVVCGVLCFLQNKMHFETLRNVAKTGFEAGEIETAKALIFEAGERVESCEENNQEEHVQG